MHKQAELYQTMTKVGTECPHCKGTNTYLASTKFHGDVPEGFPLNAAGVELHRLCIDCGGF